MMLSVLNVFCPFRDCAEVQSSEEACSAGSHQQLREGNSVQNEHFIFENETPNASSAKEGGSNMRPGGFG